MAERINWTLGITTRVRDLASKEFRDIGKVGKTSAASIAKGFIAAQAAIAAAGAAARGAVQFIKSMTLDVAAQGDEFDKMSKRVGVSVETLAGLDYAAQRSGSNLQTIERGFKALSKNAVDFSNGIGEAAEAFEELGIQVETPEGQMKEMDRLFLDAADALGKMTDETERAAYAQRIFGRAGTELIPLFKEQAGGIEALMQRGQMLSKVTTEMANESAAFTDAMLDVEMVFQGLKNTVGVELLPIITTEMKKLVDEFTDNEAEIELWAKALVENLAPAIRSIGDAIGWIAKQITAVSEIGSKPGLIKDVLDLIFMDSRVMNIQGVNEKVAQDIIRRQKAGETDAQRDAAGLPRIGPPGADEVVVRAGETDVVTDGINEIDMALGDLARGGVLAAGNAFGSMFDTIIKGSALADDAIANMVRGILDSLAKLALNKAFQALATVAFDAIAGGGGGGGGGATVDTELASGGVVRRPTIAMIGEAGPEAVIPLNKMGGMGGGGNVTVNVQPSPGMDERALAGMVAATVSRRMRDSRSFRHEIRRTARGGLF